MKSIEKSMELGGRTLTLEIGRFAEQATSAVLARYGDTMVLATVVAETKESQLSYFPLSVEYAERLYAGGRIKGSRWVKREGRPTDDAILRGRLIDRSIRPLFDKSFHSAVQNIVTILSVDGENEPDVLGIIATSAAIALSPVPWKGPIGAVRVGYIPPKNGNSGFFINPGLKESEFSEMDLVVSSTREKVVMIEAGANELDESIVAEGIRFARAEIEKIISCIEELVREAGAKKIQKEKKGDDKTVQNALKKDYSQEINRMLRNRIDKEGNSEENARLMDTITEAYAEKYERKDIETALEQLLKEKVRDDILMHEKRPDGRKATDIRPLQVGVSLLPRTHGSAVFQRGKTQVLTVATLGSPSLEQLIESPEGETAKRYIHHYSMPPYSVGETGRFGFPNRREIGHGALAERALLPVIPPQQQFPYTIRLVSEIMSSDGSTSMASTCGSTMALMDAGVPITRPVAGISIGLVSGEKKNVLLTDIRGLEDFFGDMDFKVAGTKQGITAIQLDVKIDGLTDAIIEETLSRARDARLHILEVMEKTLPQPRTSISQYAPKVAMLTVPQEKIGEVIGPGGKVIRHIIAETNCDVNVDDNGQVTITGIDPEKVDMAHRWISGIVKDVQPGETYKGVVKRILPFGAFVEILPGKEGLVHVSQMSKQYISDPTEVVTLGQEVTVYVREIDQQNRINLSFFPNSSAPPRRPSSPNQRTQFQERSNRREQHGNRGRPPYGVRRRET